MSKFDEATKTALYSSDSVSESPSVMTINSEAHLSVAVDRHIAEVDLPMLKNITDIECKSQHDVPQAFTISEDQNIMLKVIFGEITITYFPNGSNAKHEKISRKIGAGPETRLYMSPGTLNILLSPGAYIQVFECGF